MAADLDHVNALRQFHGAAIGALQTSLSLEGSQILTDAVLGHFEFGAELFDLDLTVTLHHADDELLALLQKHDIHSLYADEIDNAHISAVNEPSILFFQCTAKSIK